MEGERRKRKLENNEEEEEESEEQQLEKFFALIESTKDVRDRLSKEKAEDQKAKGITLWNPTFQPEDFIDSEDLPRINKEASRDAAAAVGPSEKEVVNADKELLVEEEATAAAPAAVPADENANKKKEFIGNDLDLTLSL